MPSNDPHSAPSAATGSASLALEARDLVFSYGGFDVLQGVSFSLKAGELAFLTGENGSGKSTLLRCLAGWADPTEGAVLLEGAPFDTSDRCQRRKVAFVPDSPAFYDDLTADEHLAFVRQANRIDAGDDLSGALMERIGLAGYGGRLPSAYSRGMRMKLALVMAFAAKPSLLLLDEPHGPLDPDAAAVLGEMVQDALDAGTAVLISCHHDVPGLQPDKVLRLEAGSLSSVRVE